MAGQRLAAVATDSAALDPAAGRVIDDYLRRVATGLPRLAPMPADVAAELREDLIDATADLIRGHRQPAAAARAAVAEFGDPATLAMAFAPELVARQARRLGRILLVSGPVVGALWVGAVSLSNPAPQGFWRFLPLLAMPLLLLGAPASVLSVAGTGRLSRWIDPSASLLSGAIAVAGLAAAGGDLILLTGTAAMLVFAGPVPSLLLGIAVVASLARLVFIARAAVQFAIRPAVHRPPSLA